MFHDVRQLRSPAPTQKKFIHDRILEFYFLFVTTAKQTPDEIMVYHLIHASVSRGQVGLFTLEEFWQPHCRVRINNTTNGSSLYSASKVMPKSDIVQNANSVSTFFTY